MLNCITIGKKIPTEIVSNLILAYSVMAKGAIIKVRFLFASKRGFCPSSSWEHSTRNQCQAKIQAVPVLCALQLALPRSSTAARARGCSWVPQYDGTVPNGGAQVAFAGFFEDCRPTASCLLPPSSRFSRRKDTCFRHCIRKLQSSNTGKGSSARGHSRKLS